MTSSADRVARLLHLAGLSVALASHEEYVQAEIGNLLGSPVAASLVPVPAVPLVAEPSSPGPDRAEVEVHLPPLVFPRGSVVGLASKSRPAVPPSPSHSPPAQTLRANAAAGHTRATASSPRGPGLQGRLSPSPAPVHSRQRVCSRCRQVGGASHDSPAASAVKVSVEDGVLSRGTTTK